MIGSIFAKHYELTDKLAKGAFYDVFRGLHKHNQTVVAVKVEPRSVSESKLHQQAKILKELRGDQGGDLGIPQMVQLGSEGNYNYLVMEMLGRSIDVVMADNGGKLDLKQVLDIGKQLIDRIQLIHGKGYVHRDIRLEHFLYGVKKYKKIYLSGMNLSKKYLRIDNKHIPYRDNKIKFTGIARFISLNSHFGIEQTRRDDIESLIYCLIFMIKGYLPWQNPKGDNRKEKYQKILEIKLITPIQIVCKDLPKSFEELLYYCRNLQYEVPINYHYIRQTLQKMSGQTSSNILDV